jgi:hypothetical protein
MNNEERLVEEVKLRCFDNKFVDRKKKVDSSGCYFYWSRTLLI